MESLYLLVPLSVVLVLAIGALLVCEWLQRSRLAGELVTVSDNGRVTRGRGSGIDEYGALLLEVDDGTTMQVLAGDVRLVNG